MNQQLSLWGDDFKVETTQEQYKSVAKKLNNPKEMDVKKVTKSKKISIEDKLKIIEADVHRILGKYENDTQVIRTREELTKYIDKAIEFGEIAIDTETNNSLDPITCKIMGGCIYTPGLKNAYIPINHEDINTRQRLDWQLTEQDLNEEFSRLSNTKIIMHNGKFDYQVIKCTCGVKLDCYWDTLVGARILNENEKAGLKEQYRTKIDSNQEKYDIEHLFQGLEYAIVSPELFALYAATDSKITYELYKYQMREFEKEDNKRLYELFKNVEMPIVEVTAEMELTGITIDKDYAKLLSQRYHKEADEIQSKIEEELNKLAPTIAQWRLTDKAIEKPKKYATKEDMKSADVEKKFPYKDANGRYTLTKSKDEQLKNPPEVTSPTQLAILLYDVLGVPQKTDRKTGKPSRSTGEDELSELKDIPLCKLILELRGANKLITTYVDKLPECVCEKDGRLHAHFNQLGTDTGRFSSTDPNLQNIPSHNKNIRMMFTPCTKIDYVDIDNSVRLNKCWEVYTDLGLVYTTDIKVGDKIYSDETKNDFSVVSTITDCDTELLFSFA